MDFRNMQNKNRKEKIKFILNRFKKAGVEIDIDEVKRKSNKELDKIILDMWKVVLRNELENTEIQMELYGEAYEDD